TRSGESLSARSRPSTPSKAVRTWKPSYSKLSRRPATMFGSSSTIRILVVPMTSPPGTSRRMEPLAAPQHSCGCGPSPERRIERQSDGELAAFVGRAFDQDFAAVRPHYVTHERQA